MWTFDTLNESALSSTLKKLRKTYPQETAMLFSRLEAFVDMLNSGLSLPQVRTRGWVHDKYRHGILSLDAGGGRGSAKLRLYVLPDAGRVIVLVAGIGKKDTQERDVKKAYEVIEEYRQIYPEGER